MQEKNTAAPGAGASAGSGCYRNDVQLSVRASGVAAFAAVCLCVLAASSAASPRWVQASPSGGSIVALAQRPSAPGIGIGDRNRPVTIWRSADHGAGWAAGETLDPPTFGVPAPRFVFDPARPGTIYLLLLTDDDVVMFRSDDGGAAWTKLTAATGI